MEIADVCATTGRVVRICDDGDDLDALRAAVAKQAGAAAAMAAEAMAGGWERPVQPVHVEPMGAGQGFEPARRSARGYRDDDPAAGSASAGAGPPSDSAS